MTKFPDRRMRRVLRLLILLASFAVPAARAQSIALVPVTRTATLSVSPEVADVGVPRTLLINGTWTDGCTPVGAKVDTSSDGREQVITINLIIPITLVACTQVITPYTQQVTVTPTARGPQRVVIVTTLGEYLSEGILDVRAASDHKPRTDITGVWFDPATNGSGLTFTQSASRPDLVFGTWYVYSNDGGSRWFTIQNTAWSQQGKVLEGDLLETRGNSVQCIAPLDACPVGLSTVTTMGRARVTLNGNHAALIEAFNPLGALLFSSQIQRIRF